VACCPWLEGSKGACILARRFAQQELALDVYESGREAACVEDFDKLQANVIEEITAYQYVK
jgi:hypothetical protein